MNVNKIQRFTKEYAELKAFHAACNDDYAELSIGKGEYRLGTNLSSGATKLIIVAVRRALLAEQEKLMEEIKKESAI